MALIKNVQADQMIKDAIVLDLGDLGREAGALLEQAREQADDMLAGARDETDRMTTEAGESGYAEGFASGRAAGVEQGALEGHHQALSDTGERIDRLVEGFTSALADWEDRRGRMYIEAREDVLAFALALAERVVHRTIEIDPAVVSDQVAAALQLVRAPTRLKITIHPDDRPLVDEAMPVLMKAVSSAHDVELADDDSISRGGCVITTSDGEVDAQIPTQLDRIAAALLPDHRPPDTAIDLMRDEE